ncbi:MAG: ATP:cob(I)alamin adenosyltransferase, partial [Clostridium baratii]|nr:ATP:cob(I)alamin adenosyltransferase [Clostridium baratii]
NARKKRLFTLGAELASDEKGMTYLKDLISKEDIENLEKLTDKYMDIAGPMTEFVIPGKNEASAHLHVARTIVRRAERRMVTLNAEQGLREEIRKENEAKLNIFSEEDKEIIDGLDLDF